MLLETLFLGVVVPAVVCGAFVIAARRPWRRKAPPADGRWGSAAGLGAAFLLAFFALEGRPGLPPHESWQWLAYLVPAAVAVGIVEAAALWPVAVRWSVRLALAAAAGWLLVGDWVERYWLWRLVGGGAVLALLAGLDCSAERAPGPSLPLSWCVAAAGAGALLLESQNAKLAQLSGALAASLGVMVALAWWRPAASPGRGAIPVFAVLLPGLLLSGYFLTFSEIPGWVFVLAAAAPLAVWSGRLLGSDRLRPGLAGALRVAAVAAVTIAALVIALAAGLGPV
ncbi:MAG: hypothetical protein ACYS0G_14505 [Planctomycetota bacterium]|jgi:hypothetical protein